MSLPVSSSAAIRILRRASPALLILLVVGFHPETPHFWDPAFYTGQLVSIWYGHDLLLHDDLVALSDHPVYRFHAITHLDPTTGTILNTFSVGPAFVQSPIVGPFVVAIRWLGRPRFDPVVLAAFAAAMLVTLALGMLALEWVLARARAGRSASRLAVWCVLAGTPLAVYTFADYSMAHHLSAMCAAWFVASSLGWARRPSLVRAGLVGVSAGTLAIVRWQDACYAAWLLPVLVERLAHASAARRRRLIAGLPVMLGCAAAIGLVQCSAWWRQFGLWTTIPQGSEFMRWSSPALASVFFDRSHGLFTWSPVVAIALVGSVLGVWRRRGPWRAVHVGGIAVFAAESYVNACVADWWGGSAYGARRFCSLAPVVALGLAELFRGRRARASRWLIAIGTGAWALVCLASFSAGGGVFRGWSPLAAWIARSRDPGALAAAVTLRLGVLPWALFFVVAMAVAQHAVVRAARVASVRRNWLVTWLGYACLASTVLVTLGPSPLDVGRAWSGFLEGTVTAAAARARSVPAAAIDFVSAVECVSSRGGDCAQELGERGGEDGVTWLADADRVVRDLPGLMETAISTRCCARRRRCCASSARERWARSREPAATPCSSSRPRSPTARTRCERSLGRRARPWPGADTAPPPNRPIRRPRRSALERGGTGVAEGLVALAHRLLEAGLGGARLERVALAGVAGDAVEHGAQDLGRVQTLLHHGLIHQQLHHHQLVHRHARDPLEQDLEA